MNIGEVPSGEKSSRDVDILLNSVYGAFLSRMQWYVSIIFHDFGYALHVREKSTKC
jgi:hypothetical protein